MGFAPEGQVGGGGAGGLSGGKGDEKGRLDDGPSGDAVIWC